MAPALRNYVIPVLVPAFILFTTGLIYAQSFTSPYIQCVQPAVQQQESNLLMIQQIFEQQHVALVAQRSQARMQAWTIPERSARRDAIRAADKAYRSGFKELKKWFRDQEKQIKRTFKDQEDICDDQHDDDIDDDEFFSSFSSNSSSSQFSFPSSFTFSALSFSAYSSQWSYNYSYPGFSSKSYYYYSYPGYSSSSPSVFGPTGDERLYNMRPVEPGEIEWMY